MDLDIKICGRDKEIHQIHQFLTSRIETEKAGILYLTGPPGTGKSMSIRYVLDMIESKKVPHLSLNCFKEQSSSTMLAKICRFLDVDRTTKKCNESETITRLTRKLTNRTSRTHIMVLDEIDQIPKSKTGDLIRTIFSWPCQSSSKLIIVGIANTFNLTSRYQATSSVIGVDQDHLTKIIFRPYSSKDIRAILVWYLENDENYEDVDLEPKALDLISVKFARENGDIRGALDALKSTHDDTVERKIIKPSQHKELQYPTPPSTPPLSPRKNKANIASVANSIKKRQRTINNLEDKFPFSHQIFLACMDKLTSGTKTREICARRCKDLVFVVLQKHGLSVFSLDDYYSMLDLLESQGYIRFKKSRQKDKIVLRATETELSTLIEKRDTITKSLNNLS